jgi:diguanylate cyclase (GGDEF)-like protein
VIRADNRGGVWIGTASGLYYYVNGRFTYYKTESVIDIYLAPEGHVWACTWGGGLCRVKNGKLTDITARDGLYADSVHQILDDGRGNFWIGSSKGVFRVATADLERYADGVQSSFSCFPYTIADGALGGKCVGGQSPSALKARDGSLWFAGELGLMRFLPGIEEVPPLALLVERVTVDGTNYTQKIGQISGSTASSIVAPPGRGDVQFDYTALEYDNPLSLRFSYKLTGFDDDWIDAGMRRSAYYTHVPPGHYVFSVRVRTRNGQLIVNNHVADIVIRPHYYQTAWFKVCCALLAILAIVCTHFLRMHRLHRENAVLERKVTARTHELLAAQNEIAEKHTELQTVHEEVLAQNDELQSMQMTLEEQQIELQAQNDELLEAQTKLEALATTDGLTGVRNHRAFQEELDRQYNHALRHNRPLSVILMDIDHFKQYNDTYGHPAGDDVLRQVARLLQDCARETDFVARYGGEEFVIILPETDHDGGIAVGDRFRSTIEQHPWTKRAITASFGLAVLEPSLSRPGDLVEAADKALYMSKKSGRNLITVWEEKPAARFGTLG